VCLFLLGPLNSATVSAICLLSSGVSVTTPTVFSRTLKDGSSSCGVIIGQ